MSLSEDHTYWATSSVLMHKSQLPAVSWSAVVTELERRYDTVQKISQIVLCFYCCYKRLRKIFLCLVCPITKLGRAIRFPPWEHCLEHFRESTIKLNIFEKPDFVCCLDTQVGHDSTAICPSISCLFI